MRHTPRPALIAGSVQGLQRPALGQDYQSLCRQARNGDWEGEDSWKARREREMSCGTGPPPPCGSHTLPAGQILDHSEGTALPGVSRPKRIEVASGDNLKTGEAIVVVGPVGTCQASLGIGLGATVTRRCYHVLFTRVTEGVRSLLKCI